MNDDQLINELKRLAGQDNGRTLASLDSVILEIKQRAAGLQQGNQH